MSDPFLAEIRAFGFAFVPSGWAACNGQTMGIAQNTALFSLLGTNYGGNGTSTFGLPNLQGSAAWSSGQGSGLTYRPLGQAVGSATDTLAASELPSHSHSFTAYTGSGAQQRADPVAGCHLARTLNQYDYAYPAVTNVPTTLAPSMIGVTGGGQSHENRQPYLAMNFCIALQGIFPQRP